MIIVEGPDGAGKTTLVNLLARELGITIGKRGTGDRSKLYEVTRQDTYTALSQAVSGHHPVHVYDRLYFSELVYSAVNVPARVCAFSQREQFMIQRVLRAMACPIIVCLPPLDVVRENILKAEQMKGVEENIDRIYLLYRNLVQMRLPGAHLYDYTDYFNGTLNAEQLVQVCNHYMILRRERSW